MGGKKDPSVNDKNKWHDGETEREEREREHRDPDTPTFGHLIYLNF